MNVMRNKASWIDRRKAKGKPMLFDYDPNQPRDKDGKWTDVGGFDAKTARNWYSLPMDDGSQILYHGTIESFLKDIDENGLKAKPGKGKRNFHMSLYRGDRNKSVYATAAFEEAYWYSTMAQSAQRTRYFHKYGKTMSFMNKVSGEELDAMKPVILEIHVPADKIKEFKRDKAAGAGGAAMMYKGDIPPEWIKKAYVGDSFDTSFPMADHEKMHVYKLRDGEADTVLYGVFFVLEPKTVADAGFDPNQERDENGRWTDTGKVDRPALIAKRKALMEEMRPLAEKGTMSGSEAKRFMELANEFGSVAFDLVTTKPFTGEKIKPEAERMSTLPKDIVMTAHADTFGNREVFMALSNAAFGTQNNAHTDVDRLFLEKPDKFYNRFNATRAALRAKFGDTMRLYRAEGKQMDKPTKNWATTREYAAQFGSNIIERDIPVDDIIAVNVDPVGNYHEMIVGKRPITKDADPDPSGTMPLQKQFKKDMRRRWQDVRKAIKDGLATYDFTGVGDRVVPFQNWLDQVMASRVLGTGKWMHTYLDRAAAMADARARGLVTDGWNPNQPRDDHGRWSVAPWNLNPRPLESAVRFKGKVFLQHMYNRTAEEDAKEDDFSLDLDHHGGAWAALLQHHTEEEIEATMGTPDEPQFGWSKKDGSLFYTEEDRQGKKPVWQTDADIDFMKTLQDHAVAELQGIMEAVSQQCTRALANGILTRKNPTNDILKLITKIGEARSNMLISHSIMKVFSVATLEAFRAQGVTQVGIIPEKVPHVHIGDAARKTKQPRGKGGKFRKYTKISRENKRKAEKQYLTLRELGTVNVMTAEDDRVCDTCERIADEGPYGIDRALSLIPAHINCRCVFIPTGKLPMYDYDPNQPRAPKGSPLGGQWIEQEGAPVEGIGGGPSYHQPDQRVFEVGGDHWNKSKATQLELEYVAAKPALIEIEQNAVGNTVKMNGDNGDWESLGEGVQSSVEEKWKTNTYQEVYDSEVTNWHDNGDSARDAAYKVAEDITDDAENDWADQAIRDTYEIGDDTEIVSPYPFTTAELLGAIKIDVNDNGSATISFDDDVLDEYGKRFMDPDQLALPGMDLGYPSDRLTGDMRRELITSLSEKFDERIQELAQDMEPPEWLADSANETLDMLWSDLPDEEKYNYYKNNIADDGVVSDFEIEDIPATYNPTQEPGKGDYEATQKMARYMSLTRGQQLIKERLGEDVDMDDVYDIDTSLWKAWVDSSTSNLGIVIQAAIADEFEARFRDDHFRDKIGLKESEDPRDFAQQTARKFFGDNGYAKVRAMLRAKWETTQFMLEKADKPTINLYRGVNLKNEVVEATTKQEVMVNDPKYGEGKFTKLPDVQVQRNGAASTTHDIDVANNWKSMQDAKVTLRAIVPRTAIISVPAYGVNIHKERESVVMGTAWVGWDAWLGAAPTLENVPLKEHNPQ